MTKEEWQIRRFLELLQDSPKGELKHQDKPDALVVDEDRVVGIEHTRLIRSPEDGKNLRAYEAVTNRVVERAQEIAEAQGVKPLLVFARFDENVKLFMKDAEALAQEVANLVCQLEPPHNHEVRLVGWRCRRRGIPLPEAIQRLYFYHREDLEQSLWQAPRSYSVPRLTREIVEGRIREKEERLPTYRTQCDEVWLLLVVEGFAPSSSWDLEWFPYDEPFPSSFDRLYLYDQFQADPRRLRTNEQ